MITTIEISTIDTQEITAGHGLAVFGCLRAHQGVAFGEAFVELVGHPLRHPLDEARRQYRRDHQHGDPQTAGDDPFADWAAPEVVPRLRRRGKVHWSRAVVLVVIFPVAPPDPCFQEPVDVSIQDSRRIAHLELGAQILDHLIGVQYV